MDIENTTSTSELLETILNKALDEEASDVHLEPGENELRVRFRIDGVLSDPLVLSSTLQPKLASRIKYMAGLKLDVKNQPQDGRFEINLGEKKGKIDVRVAVMPSLYGENIEMRLLMEKTRLLQLEELGFTPEAQAMINQSITEPHGLILNTGPTGSGKTTTLYAFLLKLNKPGVKIITIEDPIEYRLRGINQVQVDRERGFDFNEALRASLRQDPDILMIGEIRDKETADIALRAAMTGHLVLSTLHTNNAPSALARLVEMGVEPYLLSGNINLIIAQRLIRKLCPTCRGQKQDVKCLNCGGRGYKGRTAIVEILKPSLEMEKLLQQKASLREFMELAKKEGMITMEQDGMAKVQTGITSKEEIERVTKE